MADQYDHRDIEKKWRQKWAEAGIYAAREDAGKPKAYVLDMFPYPSGEGLHVGHPKGYIATDIYSRYKRMTGHSVLHPMGWDAFGLPAENYALKNKVHPRVAVEENIAHFKEQLEKIGFDYDWHREINTTDPAYYKWTQWIFLKLFEKGLAYQSDEPINWCPSCMTGLSNEDLDDGKCERCGSVVEKKRLRQWVLKITDYADRLLADLELLPKWPEYIKELQRNWIGRSEGAEIEFELSRLNLDKKIKVFTTRPDTLFGATYLVLAPEHEQVASIKKQVSNKEEVENYISSAKSKTEIERAAEGKEKTGVELKGIKAVNPANKEEIPIYVADYVLGHYGTGTIMAVPAHDERDYAFAKKFGIPIREVIIPDKIDPSNPPKEGKKTVERASVYCVLRRPSNGEILGIRWKHDSRTTLIIGGIENDEDVIQAATREISEETGYKNVKFVQRLGEMYAGYFAAHKDENRRAHVTGLLFELIDESKAEISAEEAEKHELEWLPAEEVLQRTVGVEPPVFIPRIGESFWTYTGPGLLTNSGKFDDLSNENAKKKITEFVGGKLTVQYKLRDWVFSRQRYWGEPIPIIHCEKCGPVAVPEKDLPVLLPEVEHYEPSGTGESPLATIAEWVNVPCPKCGGAGKRETNTMPQWAGSSWYYIAYCISENLKSQTPISKQVASAEFKERTKYWLPVDMYVGGAEHATRHLIYARFWHKFLEDIGVVSTPEPFMGLHSVGLIIAEDGRKMSKRFGNVINPDSIVAEYGADTLRMYEMFMGPFENAIAWNTQSLIGSRRFLERVWRYAERCGTDAEENAELNSILHRTIKKVGEDIEAFKFNTAISQMMICLNAMEKAESVRTEQWKAFIRLLAPFAPHIAEELWERLGEPYSVHQASWPAFDPEKLVEERVTLAVQINGKLRATVLVDTAMEKEAVEEAARAALQEKLQGKRVARVVVVPGRLINFVVDNSP